MRDQNENDEMDDLIRRSTQVEIPAEVEERLRHRLAAFRTKVEQRPPSRWRSLAFWPPVKIMAMAAAAVAAVVVGLVLTPREASASRVYAAAAEQLAFGNRAFHAIKRLRLDEQDRVVVANRRLEQTLGIRRRPRRPPRPTQCRENSPGPGR